MGLKLERLNLELTPQLMGVLREMADAQGDSLGMLVEILLWQSSQVAKHCKTRGARGWGGSAAEEHQRASAIDK